MSNQFFLSYLRVSLGLVILYISYLHYCLTMSPLVYPMEEDTTSSASASTKNVSDADVRHVDSAELDYIPRKYLGGVQGPPLLKVVSLVGAIGRLLFEYDQGVLSVSQDTNTQLPRQGTRRLAEVALVRPLVLIVNLKM